MCFPCHFFSCNTEIFLVLSHISEGLVNVDILFNSWGMIFPETDTRSIWTLSGFLP